MKPIEVRASLIRGYEVKVESQTTAAGGPKFARSGESLSAGRKDLKRKKEPVDRLLRHAAGKQEFSPAVHARVALFRSLANRKLAASTADTRSLARGGGAVIGVASLRDSPVGSRSRKGADAGFRSRMNSANSASIRIFRGRSQLLAGAELVAPLAKVVEGH